LPTSLVGLLIFLAFLTPGFVFFSKRRRISDYSAASPLAELAAFVTTSLLTNALAIGLYAVLFSIFPRVVPSASDIISEGTKYIAPNLGAIVGFAILLLVFSSTIAFFAAGLRLPRGFRWLRNLFPPRVVSDSAWFRTFEEEAMEGGKKRKVFVGLDLRDGTYISGQLDYFSTDPNEIADRDLVLSDPRIALPGEDEFQSTFPRLTISAREITRIHTAYLDLIEDLDSEPTSQGRKGAWKKWWDDRPSLRKAEKTSAGAQTPS
jgi:hypothetical protein